MGLVVAIVVVRKREEDSKVGQRSRGRWRERRHGGARDDKYLHTSEALHKHGQKTTLVLLQQRGFFFPVFAKAAYLRMFLGERYDRNSLCMSEGRLRSSIQ
jgi:hypothetical protein